MVEAAVAAHGHEVGREPADLPAAFVDDSAQVAIVAGAHFLSGGQLAGVQPVDHANNFISPALYCRFNHDRKPTRNRPPPRNPSLLRFPLRLPRQQALR